jgi:hypothetical protein
LEWSSLQLRELVVKRGANCARLLANPRDASESKPQSKCEQDDCACHSKWKCVGLPGCDHRTRSFAENLADSEHAMPPSAVRANPITFYHCASRQMPFEPKLDFPIVELSDPQHDNWHRLDNVSSVESSRELPALEEPVRKHESENEERAHRDAECWEEAGVLPDENDRSQRQNEQN